jgi:hypothetical protein
MISHLKEMLKCLEMFEKDDFSKIKILGEDTVEMVRLFIKEKDNLELLKDYIFLHDVAKKDCIEYKIVGEKEKKKELTTGQIVESISYIGHDKKGYEILQNSSCKIDDDLKIAIAKHMGAKNFSDRVNIKLYQKDFVKFDDKELSEKQQNFILIASLLDQLGSLGVDKQPNLSMIINMIKTKQSLDKINEFIKGKNIPENKLGNLLKKNGEISDDDLKYLITEKKENTGMSESELAIVKEKIGELEISIEEKNNIITILEKEGIPGLGKAGFKSIIGKIRQILNEFKK